MRKIVKKPLILVTFFFTLLFCPISSLLAQENVIAKEDGLTTQEELMVSSGVITDADKLAIRDLVEKHLEAFRKDDSERAFSYASPKIQERFYSPDFFLFMVKKTYPAVYRPSLVEFLGVKVIEDTAVQVVTIAGPDNILYQAYYPVVRQPDQTWRIDGCVLIPTQSPVI